MRPVIGIMPQWDDAGPIIRLIPGYHDSVLAAGGLPMILPFVRDEDQFGQLADMCDGFLFTGGPDIDPSYYGEEIRSETVYLCKKRDVLETGILKHIIEKDKPVFAICRGIQIINVALGGTLYQDLPEFRPSGTDHWQKEAAHVPTHTVNIVPGSPLADCLGKDSVRVNTFHHQGVKAVAPGLEVMARAEDGLVESFRRPQSRFFWAVQWHPEMMFEHDDDSLRLFRAFVDACT